MDALNNVDEMQMPNDKIREPYLKSTVYDSIYVTL